MDLEYLFTAAPAKHRLTEAHAKWNGGGKEIPLIQGKEQQLRFAGAAVKIYPMPKVRETLVRW